jgi:hypothetical protein
MKIIGFRRVSRSVVAVAADGGLGDWAAYIGCEHLMQDGDGSMKLAIAQRGGKLTREEAVVFFPELPADQYRD